MITFIVTLLIFFAVMALFVGLAAPLVAAKNDLGELGPTQNLLLQSPLATPILLASRITGRASKTRRNAKIDQKLIYAGKPGGDITGAQFVAALVVAASGLALIIALFFLLAIGPNPGALLFAALTGLLIYWLGRLWVDNLVADRRAAISRQFPYFLDLSVMTSEAGSTFQETVDTYVNDNSGTALAEELQIALGQIRMGKTFSEAIQALHDRLTSEEVQHTLRALLQADRMGTPLAQVLRDQADGIRFKRSQMAERVAEELKVKMQGPAMMLMLSVLLLILGPAFINMFDSGIF